MLACVKFWLEIMGYSSLYEDFKDIPEIAQFAHQCYRSGYGIFKDNWGIVMRKEGTEHFSKPSIRIPVIWFQKALGTTAE